jgi:hypothetical protein
MDFGKGDKLEMWLVGWVLDRTGWVVVVAGILTLAGADILVIQTLLTR